MIYEYVCTECETVYESATFAKVGEPLTSDPDGVGHDLIAYCCSTPILRRVSMPQTAGAGVHNPYPYFNHNVNAIITSDKHYQQVLKGKAEENEHLTGTDHRYVPVYPGDLNDDMTMNKLGIGNGADRGESIEKSRRLNWRPGKAKSTTIDMKVGR